MYSGYILRLSVLFMLMLIHIIELKGNTMSRLVKLHRSYQHRMIAGVMGGIAEYLGWSPNLTRILFVIVSCMSAAVPGILIYVVLWIMMPNVREDSYQ